MNKIDNLNDKLTEANNYSLTKLIENIYFEAKDVSNYILKNIKHFEKLNHILDKFEEDLLFISNKFFTEKRKILLKHVNVLYYINKNNVEIRFGHRKLVSNYDNYYPHSNIINKIKDIIVKYGIELELDLNHYNILNNIYEFIFNKLIILVDKIPKDNLYYLLRLENHKDNEIIKEIITIIESLSNNGIILTFNNNIINFNSNEISSELANIINNEDYNRLNNLGFKINIISKEHLQYTILCSLENSIKLYLIIVLLSTILDENNYPKINDFINKIIQNLSKNNISLEISKDINKEKLAHIEFEDIENSLLIAIQNI